MTHESTLFRQLDTTFQFFNLFGFSDSTHELNLVSRCYVLVVLSFLVFAISALISVEIPRLYLNDFALHIATHLSNSLAAIVPILTSVIYREEILKLQKKFQAIEELLLQLNVKVNLKPLIISSLTHIVSFCIIYLISNTLICYQALESNSALQSLLIYYYIPFIISILSIHRYRFFIQLIGAHACILNSVLCRLNFTDPESSLNRLRILQKAHRNLINATVMVNEIFSGSSIITFGAMYSSILYRTFILCESAGTGHLATRQFIGLGQLIYVLFSAFYDAEICGRLVN